MNNPKYVKIDNEVYEINTDFRIAIECNKIALDTNIGDYERSLAIIFKLFGEKGLECTRMDKLLELGMRYINILNSEEKQIKNEDDKSFELDFIKCEGLIRSSFKFDYNYDPYNLNYLHWYDFYNDLQNLSTSEFGNCCILNRVTSVLNEDASKIKDSKEKKKLIEMQKELKEKYCIVKEKQQTDEQKESAKAFYKELGIDI